MLNLRDTAVAFAYKTDAELKRSAWLFRLMNSPLLVAIGTRLTLWGFKFRLPISPLVKATIFKQFCGGASFAECLPNIETLAHHGTETVLDYGAEAKHSEADFDLTVEESLRAIRFAGKTDTVNIISCKITGLAPFALLEKVTAKQALNQAEQEAWQRAEQRLEQICQEAAQLGVALFIDAEESWIQDAIDKLCDLMMARYNRDKVVVYNTFQLYRHDRLAFLKASHLKAQAEGYILGAKLVRGAYMEKERERATRLGYDSPIQPDKAACDRDYNLAVEYCLQHYRQIASCLASHNEKSTLLQVEGMREQGIEAREPHLSFCQLYGMSDNLTFNLAKAGYRVAKYMPYGPVKDVIPYLIRRAKENSAVDGEVSREYGMIREELKRRKGG